MKQPWFCDTCLTQGTVTIPLHTNVYQGVSMVLAHHKKKNPQCREINKVRVKNCSNKEWRETLHRVRMEAGRESRRE